mgnify:CR=1 FL=1
MKLHSWNATQYGLGLVPTPPEKRALCAATPLKSLPEIEWHAVNRRPYFKSLQTNNNQRSTSGCVGFSAAHLASKVRHIAGQPYVKLSGPFVYGLINGGRDQGAMIYDALEMSYRTIRIRKDPETPEITGLIDYEAFCGVPSDKAAEAAHDSTLTPLELRDLLESGTKVADRKSVV